MILDGVLMLLQHDVSTKAKLTGESDIYNEIAAIEKLTFIQFLEAKCCF